MHTQVPQQQMHSCPTRQLSSDGLHSLMVGIGVGVVAACMADADNARISGVTNTHVVRSVGIGECDLTAPSLPIANDESLGTLRRARRRLPRVSGVHYPETCDCVPFAVSQSGPCE